MVAARNFDKVLSGAIDGDGSVIDLDADRAFQERGKDEGGLRVSMRGR